ncbi:MAG: DUF1385 domain-containing protein [Gemmatimonadota bacterium]
MPAETKELVLGGQAVIEGVMMKGAETYAVAVRKSGGEIVVRDFPLSRGVAQRRFAKTPVVRGVFTMVAMLVIGYRALQFSADEAIADAERREAKGGAAPRKDEGAAGGGAAMAGALALALLLGVGLFFWLPLVATRGISLLVPALSGRFAFNVVDGIVRVLVFVGYVVAIGAIRDIRRIFEYHGAEHKVVNAHERKADLSPGGVASFSRLHPRCGTSFLLFVMVIGIAVFSFIPHDSSLLTKALMRLLLLPAVAGISYEVLRLSARKAESPVFRALVAPGLLLQRLTTREPDLAQIEVAIASFRRVAPGGGTEAGLVG